MNKAQQTLFDSAMALVEKDRPDIAKTIRSFPVTWSTDNGSAYAQWDRPSRRFVLNDALLTEPIDMATSLVHEGTHAQDDLAGKLISDGDNWGINEIHAFEEASKYWIKQFPDGKPEADNFDRQLGLEVDMYRKGTLWAYVHRIYNPLYMMMSNIFSR